MYKRASVSCGSREATLLDDIPAWPIRTEAVLIP
jgi:hypothetical protein